MYITEHYQPEIKILSCDMVKGSHFNWNSDNLSAPEWRYYWMPHPHARVILGQEEYCPGAEEIVLIPPNTPFKSRCAGPLYQFVIHFRTAPPFNMVEPALLVMPAQSGWLELIREIVQLLDQGSAFDRRLAMLSISLCLQGLNAIPAERLHFRAGDLPVISVMREIEQNYAHELTTPYLARQAGMSVNAFIRRFKNYTGSPPQQYLIKTRIDRACAMLEYSAMTIDEIAEITGFCNRNHFTQSFLKWRGTGPAAYRKRAAERRNG